MRVGASGMLDSFVVLPQLTIASLRAVSTSDPIPIKEVSKRVAIAGKEREMTLLLGSRGKTTGKMKQGRNRAAAAGARLLPSLLKRFVAYCGRKKKS